MLTTLLFIASPVIFLWILILWVSGHIFSSKPIVPRTTPNMSYEEYRAYLKTQKWKIIRLHRIMLDNMQCTRCRRPVSPTIAHVHHLTYDRLGAEDINDLRTLCKSCHKEVHDLNPKLLFTS